MAPALLVGKAFFPLDEQLGLLGGGLTPRGEELLARLASWMPFEAAGEVLEELRGVRVSKATERSGCKDWSTTTERMRCVSWTRAHPAEYVNEMGQAVQAAGGRLPATWLEGVLHRLKHQGPQRVLAHLSWLAASSPSPTIQEKLASLQKREAHMQYPTYQAAGWPIGSGNVESANKVVVEARLKGAGMRLPAAQHQSHAGAAQCGLQSRVEGDVDESASSSTSAVHA